MTKKTETCAYCEGRFALSEVIWVDRALSVCVCDACYDKYVTDKTCGFCDAVLFISEREEGGLYCHTCDEHIPR